jgi:phosphoribosylformylglycinamidine (FGAM) synthase-like enzyme
VRIGEVTTTACCACASTARWWPRSRTALADEAPLYDRPTREPAWLADVRSSSLDASHCGRPRGRRSAPARLADIASKRWIYRQYDHMVRTNTSCCPGAGRPSCA